MYQSVAITFTPTPTELQDLANASRDPRYAEPIQFTYDRDRHLATVDFQTYADLIAPTEPLLTVCHCTETVYTSELERHYAKDHDDLPDHIPGYRA